MRKLKNIPKIRIIFWLVLLCLVIWLIIMDIVPSGKITYVDHFSGYSDFVTKLHPADRLLPIAKGEQKVIGDPVYFSLRTPRKFDQVNLTVKYKNEAENLPIVTIGVLVDKMLWRYLTQPLENRFLDELSKTWNVTKEGDVLLLQKEKHYESIDAFLENLPSRNKVALYNYDLKNYYYLPEYQPGAGQTLPASLRGEYQIYTYIKNEALNFDFSFLDLNQNKDADPVYVMLYDQHNKLLVKKELPDDGITTVTNQETALRNLVLSSPNLSEGVYKIEVKVNDDIITKTLKTTQSKLSFKNKIWLAEGVSNITLYTDSNSISAQTINPGSLQKIKINQDLLDVSKTYDRFTIINKEPSKNIKISLGDITITGNGVFSFNQAEMLNPAFKQVDENFSLGDTQYILAKYSLPATQTDGWQSRTVELDLSNAYREDDKNLFIISVPGLRHDDMISDYITLSEIKAEVSGQSLEEWIKSKL